FLLVTNLGIGIKTQMLVFLYLLKAPRSIDLSLLCLYQFSRFYIFGLVKYKTFNALNFYFKGNFALSLLFWAILCHLPQVSTCISGQVKVRKWPGRRLGDPHCILRYDFFVRYII
ncbi:hypothetical protein L9F63_001152, partial [Diploptera punctata]